MREKKGKNIVDTHVILVFCRTGFGLRRLAIWSGLQGTILKGEAWETLPNSELQRRSVLVPSTHVTKKLLYGTRW